MICVLGHDSALLGYTRQGTTWTDEMNIVMNHARGGGIQQETMGTGNNGCSKTMGT